MYVNSIEFTTGALQPRCSIILKIRKPNKKVWHRKVSEYSTTFKKMLKLYIHISFKDIECRLMVEGVISLVSAQGQSLTNVG